MKVHIGKQIRKVLEEKGTKASWLAERINTSDRNMYMMLNRAEIGTDQLSEISKALDYDFFALYQKKLGLGEVSGVSEKEMEYGSPRKSVSIAVQLDGTENTLNEWMSLLKRVNEALI